MEIRERRLSCEQANEKDLVAYLASLGYEPVKIRANDYWYLSPLRQEKTASFKVNRGRNVWYDHGIGKGGTLVDFGILYYGCSVAGFLDLLAQRDSSFHPLLAAIRQSSGQPDPEPKIEILREGMLSSYELQLYLKERKIDLTIADRFCREVGYRFNDKTYYAIGFKNDSGGYELRNRFFKGSTAHKDVTTVKQGSRTLNVFEGFFDFLSFLTILKETHRPIEDYLVLNSTAFFERSLPFMQQYEKVRLFLDNDATGQNCSGLALAAGSKFTDERSVYTGFKDLNDFITGKRQY